MKHLKRYNEDIEWEFDEDETDNEFRVGDKVILIDNIYEKTKNDKDLGDYYRTPSNYTIIDDIDSILINGYNKPSEIIKIEYRYDGKQIFKLRKRWPWYVASYWKGVD